MILPDVSVLVHAHNADSAVRERARRRWHGCLSGTEGIGLARRTILGFVRIATSQRVVARPLWAGDVMSRLESRLVLQENPVGNKSLPPLAGCARSGYAGVGG